MKELIQLFSGGFGGCKIPLYLSDTICIDGHALTVRLSCISGDSREPLLVDVNDVLRAELDEIAELSALYQDRFIP